MLPVLIILGMLIQVGGDLPHRRGPVPDLAEPVDRRAAGLDQRRAGAGMTFVILTGGIDLSVGSILAASASSA